MEIRSVQNINPINQKKQPLISEEFIDIDFPSNSLIVNVYDSLDNFLLQQMYKPKEYNIEFDSEESFIKSVQQLVSTNPNLNERGVYNIRYYFVDDTLDTMEDQDNTFIVTEISSDRTEVRLNPKSNDVDFIENFNRLKNYVQINVNLDEKINQKVETFINKFSDDFYGKIGGITTTIEIETDSGNISIGNYIQSIVSGDFDEQGFFDALTADIQKTKDVVTKRIKLDIVKETKYKELIDNYVDSPNQDSLNVIETYVFDYFKKNLYNEIDNVLEISLLGLE